ncbi:MAG: ABC transporter ATP-binding protein [Acidobacteriota bacterium]|nr:ABC transporter ATP-binding protein [Acidobacteriota bacterium]
MNRGGWKALLGMLKDHKPVFVFTVLAGIANLGAGIASAGAGAWIVGKVAVGADTAAISPMLWLLGGLVIAAAVFTWVESWLAHDLAYRVLATIRNKVYAALARVAPGGIEDNRSGDMVSAAMADVESLEWFYAHTVGSVVTCTLVPATVLVVLGFMHPLLPVLLLPLLGAVAVMPGLLRKRAAAQGKEMRAKLGEVNAEVVDAVQGLRELAVFNAEERMRGNLAEHGKKLVGLQLRYGLRAGLESSVSRGFTALGMLAVLAAAANLVATGVMDASLYPVTVILAGAVFGPVASLSGIAGQFGSIGAAADRVFDLIHRDPAVTSPNARKRPEPKDAHVRFHDVTFQYDRASVSAVDDISLEIRPGETVALAGHSGAGKSTCARLLMRFYDPGRGDISIGGYSLKAFPLEQLRDMIALVPQDIYLFDMSLADNIRLGRPDADDREVEGAARLAMAHDFIAALPDGYQTRAGERGLRLSGGQRQRIAIARAFLTNAPILVMDEAVSNLDSENERALQQAVARLSQNRTTLVIAHRLSTIESADRVVVLENGRVVEQGPPAKLLTAGGPLAALVDAQTRGRLKEQP